MTLGDLLEPPFHWQSSRFFAVLGGRVKKKGQICQLAIGLNGPCLGSRERRFKIASMVHICICLLHNRGYFSFWYRTSTYRQAGINCELVWLKKHLKLSFSFSAHSKIPTQFSLAFQLKLLSLGNFLIIYFLTNKHCQTVS